MLIAITVVFLCVGLGVCGLLYRNHQMKQMSAFSFQEALRHTTKNNSKAVITVGIIKNGKSSYTVYGENGKELPNIQHTYEIGSITKTFTAALINLAIQKGIIDISATIDQYLTLPEGKMYPTIEELLTHTSGYKSYYMASPMVSNIFKRRNGFYGVTKDAILNKAGELNLPNQNYKFNYSNYGFAILGLIIEAVYEKDYTSLMNAFIQNELSLTNTKVSDQGGDLGNYWDWYIDDAYIPAGAITSDINDMLTYAQMQLNRHRTFADCHKSLKTINTPSAERNKLIGVNMDKIGMAWIIDKENGIVWHNGGTGGYNSYLGFNSETGTAVVVLSNLSPFYRIPATVLGVKLLAELRD